MCHFLVPCFFTDNLYPTLGKLYNLCDSQFLPLQTDKEFKTKYVIAKITSSLYNIYIFLNFTTAFDL